MADALGRVRAADADGDTSTRRWPYAGRVRCSSDHSGRPAGNGDVASVAPGENRTVIPHPGSGRTVVGIMLISMSGHPCGFGGSVPVPSGLL